MKSKMKENKHEEHNERDLDHLLLSFGLIDKVQILGWDMFSFLILEIYIWNLGN